VLAAVLFGIHEYLGPVIEMHGVVVVPLAAPHEAVRLELVVVGTKDASRIAMILIAARGGRDY
jgi:hypothetical protein